MASLKARLEAIGCPYVRDVDESWIRDLLSQPGDARFRMIIWLFVRFDESLKPVFEAPGSRIADTEAKRILSVSNQFGLCDANDIDLILGKGSKAREEEYWDRLVDLVTVATATTTSQSVGVDGGCHVDVMSMEQQFFKDSAFMGTLCRQVDMGVAFPSSITLFPPDLIRICEQRQAVAGAGSSRTKKSSLPMPNDRELSQLREDLMKQMSQRQDDLKKLTESCSTELLHDDASAATHYCKSLRITLTTLSQLTDGFIMSYSQECLPWVQPAQPMVTELGPVCEEILVHLKHLSTVFVHLEKSRESRDSIDRLSRDDCPDVARSPGSTHSTAVSSLQQLSSTLHSLLYSNS